MGEICPIDDFIYSSPARDKSCSRRVARSRRVPFSAGKAGVSISSAFKIRHLQ